MSNIVDFPFPKLDEADQNLLKAVLDEGKFQKCHDEFFKNHNIHEMPFQKILMGFYLYGYLQASYDSL